MSRFGISGKRVYLSGPVTGTVGYKESFRFAEDVCKRLGAKSVYNPVAKLEFFRGRTHEQYMRHCLNALTLGNIHDGSRDFDTIVMLPGWQHSRGASVEAQVARECGIDIVTLEFLQSLVDNASA